MAKINVQNTEITIVSHNDDDYISLTDMARSQLQEHIIFRWLSLKSTIEYLGEWEMLYNPNFNCTEFGTFRNMAGSNNFVLSVKTWIEKTNAIGIFSKAGRYGVLQATIPVIDWQEGHSGELLSEEITAQQDEMWGEEQQG